MPRLVLQNLSDGRTEVAEAAAPLCGAHDVLVAARCSIVSAGTERMLVDFGRAGLVGKARSQPQRVVEVLDKARTDGLTPTVRAVRSKLSAPIQLGYSSAGTVVEVGRSVFGHAVGDLVATAGPHAELASVPSNLVTAVPEGVDPSDAAFATIASVALQGVRLTDPTLGERFVVVGLGLVGLVAVQLLQAHGCSVLGIDPNAERRQRARAYGATVVDSSADVLGAAESFSSGLGVDGVLVCASTKSSDPMHQAAQMCRQRGRIVLVGVAGLELQRSDFYEKELTFQVSASYGPGRYDPSYEQAGVDYPAGFVRWTAGRNMEAVLGLMATGRLDVKSLVTHEYAFEDAPSAYEALVTDSTALGIVLRYPEPDVAPTSKLLQRSMPVSTGRSAAGAGRVGLIGAGNFASQVLLPAIVASGADVDTVVSSGGTSATLAAQKFGARHASSSTSDVFDSATIDTVVVATRHDSHASYVQQAMRAGKHVFVEKPLAMTKPQLDSVATCIQELTSASGSSPMLTVGFNRRFAPITVRMATLLAKQGGPKALNLTMNAGTIPASHWTQDPAVGGGRIVGEACHFIDLARHLVGAPITEVNSTFLTGTGSADTATISLTFGDGSIATVNYFANGSKRYPKERVEVFSGGRVLVNDNFRTMRAYGWPGVRTMRVRGQDKGHRACMATFIDAVRAGGPEPIPLDQLMEVSDVSLRAAGLD